ncbi:HNH endonuclease family protein [Arthrobacter sp. MYb213]|uniref:HNH endonuclease family protein n=1 Tax=Arthrobacter sp. MYb213 TaxID=1848595 RepID=UPI000CFD68E6|nr:HNH endonuclease family protein [Arthrobacter sp. MYb213]PRB69326.1 deoxyribonuclease [Arthrobacter sp. MYb213]
MRLLRRTLSIALLASTLGLGGCASLASIEFSDFEAESTTPAASPMLGSPEEFSKSLTQLETIRVKGRAPKTGYTRDQFGKGWKDPDRNGCDARNDTLARDLENVVFKQARVNCVVLSGVFHDPYTGETINFQRGQTTSSKVQIDHVVALSDAWQKGAQKWDPQIRLEFANDPLNLMASDGSANASKGDKDAATWLPPNKQFRCAYVSRQTQVKAKYDAWMTTAEHTAINTILKSCL